MRTLRTFIVILVLLCLAAVTAAQTAEYPRLSRSRFWLPAAFDADTLALFHLDEQNQQAGQADLEAMLSGDNDLGGGSSLGVAKRAGGVAPGGSGRSLAHAGPIGVAAALQGDAKSIATGRFGGGVQLSGQGTLVLQGYHTKDAPGTQLTAECWVKLDAANDEEQALLELGSIQQPACALVVSPGGRLTLRWLDRTLDWPGVTLQPGRWTHVALGLSRVWPTGNNLLFHVDGEPVAPQPAPAAEIARVASSEMAWFGGLRGGQDGIRGAIDEVRLSRSVRQYYHHEPLVLRPAQGPAHRLDWPYVREGDDLIFHLPFNGTTAPSVSAPRTAHDVIELAEADLEFNPARVERTFPVGVEGRAAGLGDGGLRPQYSAKGNILPPQGSIAFWMRPIDWDNLTRDNRYDAVNPTTFGLFQLDATTVPGSHEAIFRKVGPLMQFTFNMHMDEGVENPPPLHPGVWTHLAITWKGADITYYVNGERRDPDGAFTMALELRTANDPYPYQKLNPRWWTESEPVTLRFRENRYWEQRGTPMPRTAVDDFRIYRRPLTDAEIRNVAGVHDPHHEEPQTAKLPDADMRMTWNGVSGVVGAEVVPLGRDYREVKSVRLTVTEQASGKPVGQAVMAVDEQHAAEVTVQTPPLEFATYDVQAELLDGSSAVRGKVSQSFTRVAPPWWENKLGISDKVMPPWEPVRASGRVLSVWGREIELGPSGLPARIVSQQEDVLAGPVRMDVALDGQPATFTAPAAKPATAISEVLGRGQGQLVHDALTIDTAASVEFDGMMWFTVTLAPREGATPSVTRLVLTIPRTQASCRYLHWWSGPRDMRNPKHIGIGELPTGDGVVFRSNDRDKVTLVKEQRGSFIPYVMLTGDDRGMAWFAENDQGWTPGNPAPGNEDNTPAVSVVRRDGRVELVLNIISQPVRLTGPRSFAFGLHPIPVRPLDPLWRRYPTYSNVLPDTFSGNNLKGRKGPSSFYLYPEDDWDAVQRRIDGEGLTKGAAGLKGKYHSELKRLAERGITDPPPQILTVPGLYWDLQWNGIPPSLTHTREWAETWALNYQYYTPAFVDFCSWAWNDWITKTDKFVRGVYMDDCWAAPLTKPTGPTTYTLPDGATQPGYQFLGPRHRVQRMRQISHDNGVWPSFTAHTTHTFFIPYHTCFELILDGEDFYSSPPEQSDFIDHWRADRMRFMHNAKWGLVTTWLSWHGNSLKTDNWPAWTFRQQRAYTAWMALHDILWVFDPQVLDDFGLRQPDTRFLSYWGDTTFTRHQHQHLKAGAWLRPGKALLLLVNDGPGRLEAKVPLVTAALGLGDDPAAVKVLDRDPTLLTYFAADATATKTPDLDAAKKADDPFTLEESPQDLPLAERRARDPDGLFRWENGVLSCPVRRHDYRLFELRRRSP